MLLNFSSLPEDVTFYFSVYKNGVPGSGKTVVRSIIQKEWLSFKSLTNLNETIPEGYEIAINSSVEIEKEDFHIPLIDFSYKKEDENLNRALEILKIECRCSIYLFKSGHSFHAYLDKLLTQDEWHIFLGKLLLLNNLGIDIVDPRWIGHSLIQNYSALRITRNTASYIQEPRFIKKIEY